MKKKRKTYTKEFKKKVVKEYLKEELTISQLTRKYNITHPSILHSWVKKYFQTIGKPYTSRKNSSYTFQFKVNVVEYFLEARVSFQEVADKFNVKNQSIVANWYYQAMSKGILSLLPKEKGRRKLKENKDKNKLTEKEINKILAKENQLLRIENEFLKKKHLLLEEKKSRKKKK